MSDARYKAFTRTDRGEVLGHFVMDTVARSEVVGRWETREEAEKHAHRCNAALMDRNEGICVHCGKPITRIKFTHVTGDPYMWAHRDGAGWRCGQDTATSPYAEPKEQ